MRSDRYQTDFIDIKNVFDKIIPKLTQFKYINISTIAKKWKILQIASIPTQLMICILIKSYIEFLRNDEINHKAFISLVKNFGI